MEVKARAVVTPLSLMVMMQTALFMLIGAGAAAETAILTLPLLMVTMKIKT